MAIKEELAAKLAGQLARVFSEEVYGPEGPELDCDIDEIEDLAVLAARAAFDAVIARALVLQNQKLPSNFPVRSATQNVPSSSKNGPSKVGWDRPRSKNRFVTARSATEIFFPQREALRLDSQNLTPRARRKVVYAGGNEKSHRHWLRIAPRTGRVEAECHARLGTDRASWREMKEQQTTVVEDFHQREASRPLTASREVSPEAPVNLPQVGVVEMDGGRIRTRDENSPRGVTDPHWREFQAGCVVRLQSEASVEDPRPEVPRLFLNRPKVQKLVAQLHRQRKAMPEETVRTRALAKYWRKKTWPKTRQIRSLPRPPSASTSEPNALFVCCGPASPRSKVPTLAVVSWRPKRPTWPGSGVSQRLCGRWANL